MTSPATEPRTSPGFGGEDHDGVGRDWWYIRVYPGGPAVMDEASRVLVPWLRDRAADVASPRWFFMRYWDLTGHHLRLRAACSPQGADRLHELRHEASGLVDSLSQTSTQRLVPGAVPADLPERRAVSPCLYAPELAKYGGRAGVALAEELFTAASERYIALDPARLAPAYDRAALATTYMIRLVSTALPADRYHDFWRRHQRFWGGQLRMAASGTDDIKRRVTETASGIHAARAPSAAENGLLDEHSRAVAQTLDRATELGVPVEREELLLHYLHMDMNRWGLVPVEEAVLGIIAGHSRPAR